MSHRPYQLPRVQKAEIYKRIETLDLNPHDFRWLPYRDGGRDGEELFHTPTSSFSAIRERTTGGLWASWRPAFTDGSQYGDFHSDPEVASAVLYWLNLVKAEDETPDFWAALAEERELVSGSAPDGDRRFTEREIKLLRERLKLLEEQVKTIAQPTPEQAIRITATFQTASNTAERLSRTEWKMLFAGALLDQIVGLALDPTRMQQILHLANIYIGPLVAKATGLLT